MSTVVMEVSIGRKDQQAVLGPQAKRLKKMKNYGFSDL